MAVKKRTEPDWQDLRIFLALGRYGSLSAAARALSVNHATIARRIQSLEATLGEKLVERRPEGYALTEAGRRALTAASDMEVAAQTIGRDGSANVPRGLVRVNAPPALAQGFLIRRLAQLASRYPGLDIDLATDLRAVSLERHEADIAIRLDRPHDGDLLAKRLSPISYGFYGTPAVCKPVEEGASPVFVGFDEANAYLQEAIWLARHFPAARIAFRANNHVAQASAAVAGAGLALVPHYIGRTTEGLRLCRLEPVPPARDAWLLTRRHGEKELPVRTVIDHITHAFATEHALFEL